MITAHHLETSRSQRVLWLFEELGLPYEIKHYKRDPKTRLAPAALKAVHPLGKSPVIADGDAISIADFQMSFAVEAALARSAHTAQYAKLAAYRDRMGDAGRFLAKLVSQKPEVCRWLWGENRR